MLKVIDFWAPWCGPCKVMMPVLESLTNEYNKPDSEVEIIKVNADEDPDLCRKYNIRSIPTMIFEKNGEVVKTLSGVNKVMANMTGARCFMGVIS